MYEPILVMLQTGSTVYVHQSKCKVFVVTYMKFTVCLSCSIHDFYEFLFSFFAVMVCVIPQTPQPVCSLNTNRDMAMAHSIQKEELSTISSNVLKIRLNVCVTLRATPPISF